MAALTVKQVVSSGLDDTLVAAASGGDTFANTGKEFIRLNNADGSATNATLTVTKLVDGLVLPDRVVAVPAGKSVMIGPLPVDTYNDASGDVAIAYSSVLSLTVGVFKVLP